MGVSTLCTSWVAFLAPLSNKSYLLIKRKTPLRDENSKAKKVEKNVSC